MNKAELIIAVADSAEVSKKEAEIVVDAVFDQIVKAVAAGKDVKVSGFGIFAPKTRAAREGTNPSTQEKIKIPASKTVAFKPSKSLKEAL